MKKNSLRLLGFLLVAVMMVSLFGVGVFAGDTANDVNVVDGGDAVDAVDVQGSEADLLIGSADELKAFASAVNAGDSFAGKVVKLTADIDLYELGEGSEPVSFTPIGKVSATPFEGTFDGQDHTIKNLYQSGWAFGYEWGSYGSLGLFGNINDATVKNLTLTGAECVVEGGDVAGITGSATGTCVFENITITDSVFATYNNGCGSIIAWSGAGSYTFKNITIASDVTLAGLWGSFDSSIGGLVGQAEPGATYDFEDVYIACRVDAYNDCTASYDYYNYRMCGMIMGRLEETTTIDGRNYPDTSKYNITCTNVTVEYGYWMDYHYCEPTPSDMNGGRGMRVEAGYSYGGLPADYDHSNCTINHMNLIPFDQLFGGAQYGVDGLPTFEGVTVIYPFYAAQIDGVKYKTLSEAIAAVRNGETITLLADIDEDVTIKQQKDLSFTIDGADKIYTGTMTIDGNKRSTGAETLTVKNVKFVADTNGQHSITTVKNTQAHNITVDGCSFTGIGEAEKKCYGIYLRHAYNITVKNTTATKVYDLVYGNAAVTGFTAENVTVTDSTQGIILSYVNSTATFKNVTMSNVLDAIAFNNNTKGTVTIEDCTITANRPVLVNQKNSDKVLKLVFKGTNTFTAGEGNKWLTVVGQGAKVTVDLTGATYLDINDITYVETYYGIFKTETENVYDIDKRANGVAAIGNYVYATLADAFAAAVDGDVITLLKDVTLSETVLTKTEGAITLDLGGYTITTENEINPAIRVLTDLTVKNGTMDTEAYCFIVGGTVDDTAVAGNLTIVDGTYHGGTSVASVTKGTLTVLGGDFSVEPYEGNYGYTLNCIDANYKDGTASIVVKGGTFYKFNPENNASEGVGTNYVPVEYMATADGDNYVVTEWNYEIWDWDDLKKLDAIVEGGNMLEGVTVKLMDDINLYEMGDGEPVTFNPIGANKSYFKGTFDGQGHTIKNMYQSGWALGYDWDNYGSIGLFAYLWDATVKNLTIENAECFVEGGNVAAIAGCAWGDCKFENITVRNSKFATYNNRAGGIVGYTGGNGTFTFKDVTVDENTVIAGLWGSFDSSMGGIMGQLQSDSKAVFENVRVACRIDAYNDVTASYKYYAYRMCGMLIGRVPVDANNKPILDNVTFVRDEDGDETTYVNFGEWARYLYIQNNVNGYGWQRVQPGYTYGGADIDLYPDANIILLPFTSLFGGQQYGSYGQAEHEDVIINYPYEAAINGINYWTLADAFAAAKDGDTIVVLRDLDVYDELVVSLKAEETAKSITLDLNGKTLNAVRIYPVIRVQDGNTLTITGNGAVVNATDYVFVLGSSDQTTAGNLIIENGTFEGLTTVASVTKGALTVLGGEFKTAEGEYGATYLLNCIDANYKDGTASIVVKGGRFYGFNPENNAAEGEGTNFVPMGYRASVYGRIDDVDVYDVVELKATVEAGGITYYFPGVENIDNVQELANYYFLMQKAMGWILGYDYEPVLTLFAELTDEVVLGNTPSDDTTVTLPDTVTWTIVTNGFNADLIKAADGYVKIDNGDGTITIQKAVAQVGDTYFATLQDAFAACTNGETITLLVDLVYDADDVVPAHGGATGFGNYDQYNPSIIYIGGTKGATAAENQPSNVNAVLDLNGHTITNNADAYLFLFMDNCKVTIKDSKDGDGIIGNTEAPVIWVTGTDTLVTIESGKYTTVNAEGLLWSTHGGDLVIKGGEFSTSAEDASLLIIRNAQDRRNPNYFIDGKATVTIYGGTYYGFDPEKTMDDSTDPFTEFDACADGYKSIKNGNAYTVENYVEWIKAQLLAGNDVVLEKDIVVDGSMIESIPAPTNGNGRYPNYGIFNVVGDYDVTFDLNGHTITYNGHESFEWNGKTINSCTVAHGLFFANDGAHLTIVGEGDVIVNGVASGVYSASPDTAITVQGGNWVNNGCAECGATNLFLYASHGGELYIEGGRFEQALDSEGNSYLIVVHGGEYKNSVIDYSKTKIVVTGGTFVGMNPNQARYFYQDADNNTDMSQIANVVAPGYAAVGNGNGVWTIVDAVAHINGIGYATLAAAIDAAKPGDTIEFLTDITEDVTVDENVTINGAEFKYTGTMTLKKVNVTIENVNFVSGTVYKHKNTGVGGNFTIKNCTFDGQGLNTYAVNLGGTGAIVIENVTAKNYGYGFLQVPASNNSISIKDVTVENVNYGFKIDYSNGVTIENVNVKAKVAGLLNSNYGKKTITIKDSYLSILGTWNRNSTTKTTIVFEGQNTVDEFAIDETIDNLKLNDVESTLTAPAGATVTIDAEGYTVVYVNGTYKAARVITVTFGDATMVYGNTLPEFTYTTDFTEIAEDGLMLVVSDPVIDVTGVGEYNITSEAYVFMNDDYVVVVVPGKLTVVEAVAQIGDTYYASIQDAIDMAQDGDVITVIADHELTEVIQSADTNKYSVYLDVQKNVTIDLNGKTITANPAVDGKLGLVAAIYVGGNGNLTLTDSVGGGQLAVTAVKNVYSLITLDSPSAKLTIKNGHYSLDKVLPGQSLIYAGYDQTIFVEGGSFYLGNITPDISTIPWMFNVGGDGIGAVTVTGGNYNSDPRHYHGEVYIPETHAVVQNADGSWSVVPAAVYVIEEDGEKVGYATLADAIAAVQNGETIVFLTDLDENVTIKQQKDLSFTINGNDKKFTGTIKVDGSNRNTGAETLTIQNVNFIQDTDYQIFVEAVSGSYAHNVTVDSCIFLGTNKTAYGMKIPNSYNITLNNCTAYNMLEIAYSNKVVTGFTAENVSVEDSLNGFYMSYVKNASFKDVTINASNVGIYVNNYNASAATFENCDVEAKYPVVIEETSTSNAYTLTFNGTNSFIAANDGAWLTVDGTKANIKVIINDTALDMTKTSGLVAQNGNVYYNVVAYAITEAQDGDTVVLLADSTSADVVVNTEKKVTLDLNGKTLTANITVTAGNLTVIDSSTEDFELAGSVIGTLTAESNKTLTLHAGTYTQDVNVFCADRLMARDNKDGTWTVCLGIVYNKTFGTTFGTIADAVADAVNTPGADYLILLQDHEEFLVTILEGMTLDLQDKTLTATYVFAAKGGYLVGNSSTNNNVNNGATAQLVVPKNNVALSSEAYYSGTSHRVLVWDKTQNAYVFSAVTISTKSSDGLGGFHLMTDELGQYMNVKFKLNASNYVYQNILTGSQADHGIKVVVTASWNTDTGVITQNLVFSDEDVLKTIQNSGWMNTAKVYLQGHDGLVMTVQIVTNTGNVIDAVSMTAAELLEQNNQ